MEFKKISFYILCGCGLINFSCSPYQRLVTDFNNNKTSISYLHTTPQTWASRSSKISVSDPILLDKKFPKMGEVTKLKNEVIPLIVVNTWKHEFSCKIGKAQIKEEIEPFIQSSIIEESRRSGTFEADTLDSPLKLEIEIDSLGANGPFVNSGYFFYFFFGYAYSVQELAGPGYGYCTFHYKVKRGDNIILEDYIRNRSSFEPLKSPQTSFKKFHEFYRANLVESMSDAIRKNVEELVAHLNILFDEEISRAD